MVPEPEPTIATLAAVFEKEFSKFMSLRDKEVELPDLTTPAAPVLGCLTISLVKNKAVVLAMLNTTSLIAY